MVAVRTATVRYNETGQLVSEYGPIYPAPALHRVAGPATRNLNGEWTAGTLAYTIDDFQPSHTFSRELFALLPLEPDDGFLSIHKYEDAGDWYVRIEQGADEWGRKAWTYRMYETDDGYLGVWPD